MVLYKKLWRVITFNKNEFPRILTRSASQVSASKSGWPDLVRIVEVGPRDGLQNEKSVLPTDVKVELINRLSATGLTHVEATSYVSPKWVPQMGDSKAVMDSIQRVDGVTYPVLVPNLKGLESAMESRITEVAVFGSASEAFSQKNTNSSLEKGTERCIQVTKAALAAGLRVRGYVSCVFACPYQGVISPDVVTKVASQLMEGGCYEISLGDTIGVGTPGDVERLLSSVTKAVPVASLAMHCHDTYGQALANILLSLQMGVRVFDSSIAGLGGCPYARGATGNVSTEDLVYMLHGLGINTGVRMDQLLSAANFITTSLGQPTRSHVGLASSNHKLQQ